LACFGFSGVPPASAATDSVS